MTTTADPLVLAQQQAAERARAERLAALELARELANHPERVGPEQVAACPASPDVLSHLRDLVHEAEAEAAGAENRDPRVVNAELAEATEALAAAKRLVTGTDQAGDEARLAVVVGPEAAAALAGLRGVVNALEIEQLQVRAASTALDRFERRRVNAQAALDRYLDSGAL